jgi:hypothetical protein
MNATEVRVVESRHAAAPTSPTYAPEELPRAD